MVQTILNHAKSHVFKVTMALFSQLFPSFLLVAILQGGRGLSPRSGEQTAGEDSAAGAGGAGAPRQAGHCKARSSAVAIAAIWTGAKRNNGCVDQGVFLLEIEMVKLVYTDNQSI